MKKKSIFNWSGGKDSALALYKILQQDDYKIGCLLTSINKEYQRISMHGIRKELLIQQAQSIGLPLEIIEIPESTNMDTYDQLMLKKLSRLKKSDYEYSIFGDIFLEDLRAYREQKLAEAKLRAVFPLWKIDTKEVIQEFIDLGFKTMVVAADANLLGKEFVGRIIDLQFLKDLPKNVDPCGENGEFHTFVFDGPIFHKPIDFTIGEKVLKEYKNDENSNWNSKFWYCDLIAKDL
jgi:uncharacterized protein (TIGR00290 family)